MRDKLLLLILPILLLLVVPPYFIYKSYKWRSPEVNWESTRSAHSCIYNKDVSRETSFEEHAVIFSQSNFLPIQQSAFAQPNYQEFSFYAKGGRLNVSLVKRSALDCINPYFPTIHIKTNAPHNAWLQVVFTDFKDWRLSRFIDTAEDIESEIYPFYTFENEFYDSPIWQYGLFSIPVSFWRAHTYAVQVNHKRKTIKFVGGVSWGFEIAGLNVRPTALMPHSISPKVWGSDWLTFEKKLSGYRRINTYYSK